MPSAARGHSAVAVVDSLLSDWARREGLDASPGRVRSWRRSGLLPKPTEQTQRPVGAPPGRTARTYDEADARTAKQIVKFLAVHMRPGRGASELALLLFAHELPVRHELVVDGLRAIAAKTHRELARVTRKAAAFAEYVEPDMRLTDAYERAENIANMALATRSGIASAVRRELRRAGQPHARTDVFAVLVALFRTVLGEPPPSSDTTILEQILYAFAGHGIVEPISPEVGPLLPEGPAGLADALQVGIQAHPLSIPDDITRQELTSALLFAKQLTTALAAIPPELRHHLGGVNIGTMWRPDDPDSVAFILTWFVKMMRMQHLDAAPIVDAVRAQGWLNDHP